MGSRSGRVVIELKMGKGGRYEANIMRTSEEPELAKYADALVRELVRLSPDIDIRTSRPALGDQTPVTDRNRGGRIGAPEEHKRKIVEGWLLVRGKMKQQAYARAHGISVSTLKRWIQDIGEKGGI